MPFPAPLLCTRFCQETVYACEVCSAPEIVVASRSVIWGIAEMVELLVRKDGRDELVYVMKSVAEATEMVDFLSDFWPDAQFVMQPLRH